MHFLVRGPDALDERAPFREVGLVLVEVQHPAEVGVEAFVVQHERDLVEDLRVDRGDDALGRDVAELRDLLLEPRRDRPVAAAHDRVGLDAPAAQLGDGVLGRLGLLLARRTDVRHERDVHVEDVLAPDLVAELPDRFEERQDLDVADRAADLGDHDVDVVGGERVDPRLDLVGDVRDDLHRLAEVLAAAFLGEHRLVDRAGGRVRLARERDVDEALVVAEVEVGLALVVGDEHLAVLERVHRARVDVDVRVELLHRDPQPATLEQSPERRGREALAETGCNTTGHEDVLGHLADLQTLFMSKRCHEKRGSRARANARGYGAIAPCGGDGADTNGRDTWGPGLGGRVTRASCTTAELHQGHGRTYHGVCRYSCTHRLPSCDGRDRSSDARTRGESHVARAVGLALLALVIRLPMFFSPRHVLFDDGVYGATVLAMRHGARPFHEVFSPQGPLHLPILYAGDLLGFRTLNAPRVAPVLAGIAVTLAVWAAGRRLGASRWGAGLAGGLAATTGTMLWTTGPITGDGIAVAFAAIAAWLALTYRDRPRWCARSRTGLAMGAALTVKVLVVPVALPVAWWLWSARRVRDLVARGRRFGRARARRHPAVGLRARLRPVGEVPPAIVALRPVRTAAQARHDADQPRPPAARRSRARDRRRGRRAQAPGRHRHRRGARLARRGHAAARVRTGDVPQSHRVDHPAARAARRDAPTAAPVGRRRRHLRDPVVGGPPHDRALGARLPRLRSRAHGADPRAPTRRQDHHRRTRLRVPRRPPAPRQPERRVGATDRRRVDHHGHRSWTPRANPTCARSRSGRAATARTCPACKPRSATSATKKPRSFGGVRSLWLKPDCRP